MYVVAGETVQFAEFRPSGFVCLRCLDLALNGLAACLPFFVSTAVHASTMLKPDPSPGTSVGTVTEFALNWD